MIFPSLSCQNSKTETFQDLFNILARSFKTFQDLLKILIVLLSDDDTSEAESSFSTPPPLPGVPGVGAQQIRFRLLLLSSPDIKVFII